MRHFPEKRALMIRTCSAKQLTLAEFDWPFDSVLDKSNRWVKLSACIPQDKLAENYYQGFRPDRRCPMKAAHLAVGTVIIKHKLHLSDMEIVQQIQENPYLQYFVGLTGFQQTAPFAPSLLAEIRKLMGRRIFEGFRRTIIDAYEGPKRNPRRDNEPPQPRRRDFGWRGRRSGRVRISRG